MGCSCGTNNYEWVLSEAFAWINTAASGLHNHVDKYGCNWSLAERSYAKMQRTHGSLVGIHVDEYDCKSILSAAFACMSAACNSSPVEHPCK